MDLSPSLGALPLQHMETVLDAVSDAVITIDRDYIITSFNRAAEQATGVDRARALGRSCRDVLRSAVCTHVGDCPMIQLLATGSDSITRQYVVNHYGREIPFSVSVYALRDRSGASVGGVETFRRLVPAGTSAELADNGLRPTGSVPRPKASAGIPPLEASQRHVIEEVLRHHQWNRAATCEELGVSRTTLWRKMRRLGITPPPS